MELSGKVVLLTWGSRGIGPVMAEAFANRGAIISLAARSEKGLVGLKSIKQVSCSL